MKPKVLSHAQPLPKRVQTKDEQEILQTHSHGLLQALHILTREGRLNQDAKRKLKQVHHLLQLMEGPMRELALAKGGAALSVVDHGAGKSYLGFMLYDHYCRQARTGQGLDLEIHGLEMRQELVLRAQETARAWGFEGMHFWQVNTQEAGGMSGLPAEVDVVSALHACDTASDDAIEFALEKRAKLIFLVPCCQAQVASLLRKNKAHALSSSPLAEMWRHPIHTREMGSQITNVMRCLYLQSQGYQVTVTELVGWEHSMKNELISARWVGHASQSAAKRLHTLVEQFGLEELKQTRFKRLQARAGASQVVSD